MSITKRIKNIVSIFLVMLLSFSLLGCGSNQTDQFSGKWGYIHDAETVIMNFKSKGNVIYKGASYSYKDQGDYLELTAKDKKAQDMKLRYKLEKDQLYIYETTSYTYQGEGSPEGVVGEWLGQNGKWKFEFTSEGTFMEDGYFPGYYLIDDINGMIKLIYNDQFEDTLIYYHLDGNTLTLEYPWQMVKAQ